jgi:hypothetical protein
MNDYLLDAAWEHLEDILRLYEEFEDKKPVMLYDMQEERICAYPYAAFSAELSERSQHLLKEQYEAALSCSQFVLFVRDNQAKRLVSFSIDNEAASSA